MFQVNPFDPAENIRYQAPNGLMAGWSYNGDPGVLNFKLSNKRNIPCVTVLCRIHVMDDVCEAFD